MTYDKLLQLSKGLSVDIERLFSAQTENNDAPVMGTGRRSVTRGNDGFVIESGVYSYNYLAQELVQKRFTPVVMDLHARSLDEFEELLRHEGDELAFVLEGEVTLCTDVYEPLKLRKGESVYFDSGTAHAYLNAGPGTARILCIASTAAPPRKKSEYPTPKQSQQASAAGSGRYPRSPGTSKATKLNRKA